MSVRVLRVFSRLNIGGPAVHVMLLSEGLRARGYETRLVVGREGPQEGSLLAAVRERGVDCLQVPWLGRELRAFDDVRAAWTLYRRMREYRPHIVHTHTAKAGALGRFAALLARVPVVIHTYHGHVLSGYFGRLKTAAFRAAERLLGRISHALVTVSASVRDELIAMRIAPAGKVHVIPLGLELEHLTHVLPRGHLRAEAGFPAEAPMVGMVGRLAAIKDVSTFLRAAAHLHAERPDLRFALVGDGPEREALQKEASTLGLDDVLHFHGWKRDMAVVYGDLDVAVNSSRNEGTPVALIEAMAAGRPVVATTVGGTPDLLGAGARGVLVAPGDARALAAAVASVVDGGEEIDARCRRAREYVLAHHGVQRLVDDIDHLYRGLLAMRVSGA